jgi:hypothetical protein
MSIEDWITILQTAGVPGVALACSFYYIYRKDQWAMRERQSYMEKDSESDKMILELAQNSITAINTMSTAMELHTKSIDQLLNEIRRTK